MHIDILTSCLLSVLILHVCSTRTFLKSMENNNNNNNNNNNHGRVNFVIQNYTNIRKNVNTNDFSCSIATQSPLLTPADHSTPASLSLESDDMFFGEGRQSVVLNVPPVTHGDGDGNGGDRPDGERSVEPSRRSVDSATTQFRAESDL